MGYMDMSSAEFAITVVGSIIYTLLLYGLGPLIYVKKNQKPVSKKKLKRFCILYTIVMWFLNALLNAVLFGEGTNGGSAALIWGMIFYGCAKRALMKRDMLLDKRNDGLDQVDEGQNKEE